MVVHALHYGLLVAGLVTVAPLVWSVHRRRRADAHDERVRRLRAAVLDATPADEHPARGDPPSAG